MKELIEGIIGALLVSLLPLAVVFLAKLAEEKERDHTLALIFDRLETVLLDNLNRK